MDRMSAGCGKEYFAKTATVPLVWESVMVCHGVLTYLHTKLFGD